MLPRTVHKTLCLFVFGSVVCTAWRFCSLALQMLLPGDWKNFWRRLIIFSLYGASTKRFFFLQSHGLGIKLILVFYSPRIFSCLRISPPWFFNPQRSPTLSLFLYFWPSWLSSEFQFLNFGRLLKLGPWFPTPLDFSDYQCQYSLWLLFPSGIALSSYTIGCVVQWCEWSKGGNYLQVEIRWLHHNEKCANTTGWLN